MNRYDQIVSKSRKLYKERDISYGDSWKVMRFDSIIDLILMKLWRIRNAKKPKIDDELQDCLNYIIMAIQQNDDRSRIK